MDIIIPTCKAETDVAALVDEVRRTATGQYGLTATCLDACAAANRNAGLAAARAPFVVMIDDDVTGFPAGWNEALVAVLVERPACVMVSARLLDPSGNEGQMLGNPERKASGVVLVPRRELPTACIAIRNDGMRFDEGYVGSGWEDTDFCARLRAVHPDGEFAVLSEVAVIHKNEQKNQGPYFHKNKARYASIWGAHKHYK